jgi:heptosyltransferase I
MEPASRRAPRRVLIILLGAIGDVVRALPLLGRIRGAWPDAHIAWAIEPLSAPVLGGHPWLDGTIIYDRSRAPWSFLPFLKRIREGHFDLAIDLQRHLKSGIISMYSGAHDRIGFAPANTKEGNHRFATRYIEPQPEMRLKLMQYQAFGDALGIPQAPIEFGLAPADRDEARVAELLKDAPRPLLGVIVGSSWPSRIYFPEMIAAAIRDLARANGHGKAMFPVLLGGPDETALGAQVVSALDGVSALNLVGKTSIRDLIGIFSQCDAAFGPDSGPMHIAAAVGCPIVSLWGATSSERSAPWGFDAYALTGEIPCHPCYLRKCPIGRECMRRIEPAAVASMVRRAIDERSAPSHHPNFAPREIAR